jgi:SpoVK/Ycf46/Vps4 family AAA+-type ATPase
MRADWSRAHGLSEAPVNAVYDVRWGGHALRVVVARWLEGFHQATEVSLVVADSMEIARAFAQEVCVFCNQPGNSILRFTAGCWSESHELWTAIQAATFDDLVLAGDLKAEIQRDFKSFLAAREEYERYGVPWKRGVLLVGPPGNGKTHCLRALIKFLGVPCLYVQSFKSRYGEEDSNIEAVFHRAKEITPCCLVFEDLDAMIHDGNRSIFLNQLDGLGSASGLLTIATTNHADKLDPAIVERPSRFDRKYHFELPGPAERKAYLTQWNAKLDVDMKIDDAACDRLVDATKEFSFAYLKELYLSAMMRWMSTREAGGMSNALEAQADALREQMKTGASAQAPTTPGEDGMAAFLAAMGKRR